MSSAATGGLDWLASRGRPFLLELQARVLIAINAIKAAAESLDITVRELRSELREHAKCRMLSTRHEPYLRLGSPITDCDPDPGAGG
jgi:hypothetical protein